MAAVAVFTAFYPPAVQGGGPIRSTEVLVETAPHSLKPIVLTSNHDLGSNEKLTDSPNAWVLKGRAFVWYMSSDSFTEILRGFRALKLENPKVLYFNSFFSARFAILPLLLWKLGYWGKPLLLLAPRGEFGNGAMNRSTIKKRIYMWFFRFLGMHRSIIWHSTAAHETADIRREWGGNASIIFREEGTLLPREPLKPMVSSTETTRFVFLGRIVEHKGLAIVLESLSHTCRPISLDIYGPAEDASYFALCRQLVANLPSSVFVNFKGVLLPDQVRRTLAVYDALLMPTAGENFGHVIAEALSVSCPVFSTASTPWTKSLASGGGVVVETRDPVAWHSAIDAYTKLSLRDKFERRENSGEAYRRWRECPEKPHVWTLALQKKH